MLKIGITGGIGSGKTHVCKHFESLGVPVYNADNRAKYLMNSNPEVQAELMVAFGKSIYKNNALDRQHLASIVFNNKEKLQQLNRIVHPAVHKDSEAWMHQNQHAPYILKEAALLFETKSYKALDKIILVHAPKDIRILRVMQRDRITKQQVEARIKNQMPDADKMALADYILNNDGNTNINYFVERLHTLFQLGMVA